MRRCLVVAVMLLAACAASVPDVTDGIASTTTTQPPGTTTSEVTSTTTSPPGDTTTTTTGSTTAPPNYTTGAPGGPGAAADLVAEAKCDPEVIAQAVADLVWAPAIESGEAQVVEVSIYEFEPGLSTYSPELEPGADGLTFTELSGQAVHKWRVLTLHGQVWTPSEPGSFVGPTCTADGP